MTTTATTGHFSYYPEMGEQRPEAQIEARLCHYGQHWFLTTALTLKGRGIIARGPIQAGHVCGPRAAELVGLNQYKVTDAAFDKLCQQYSVVSEMHL
jgi:hypothetical protein